MRSIRVWALVLYDSSVNKSPAFSRDKAAPAKEDLSENNDMFDAAFRDDLKVEEAREKKRSPAKKKPRKSKPAELPPWKRRAEEGAKTAQKGKKKDKTVKSPSALKVVENNIDTDKKVLEKGPKKEKKIRIRKKIEDFKKSLKNIDNKKEKAIKYIKDYIKKDLGIWCINMIFYRLNYMVFIQKVL